MSRVVAVLRAGLYQPPAARPVWHTVRDAAQALGVSEARIRHAMRAAGARPARSAVGGHVELSLGTDYRGYLPCVVLP